MGIILPFVANGGRSFMTRIDLGACWQLGKPMQALHHIVPVAAQVGSSYAHAEQRVASEGNMLLLAFHGH